MRNKNTTDKLVIDTCLEVLVSSMALEELVTKAFEQARINKELKVNNKLINKKAYQALSIWLAEQDIQEMQETELVAYRASICASLKDSLNVSGGK